MIYFSFFFIFLFSLYIFLRIGKAGDIIGMVLGFGIVQQIFFVSFSATVNPDIIILNLPVFNTNDFNAAIFKVLFIYLIILLLLFLLRDKKNGSRVLLHRLLENYNVDKIVVFVIFLNSLYIFFANGTPVSFLIRLIYSQIFPIIFMVGYLIDKVSFKHKFAFTVFSITFFAFAMVSGNRGVFVQQYLLFFMGYFINDSHKRKVSKFVVLLLIAFLLMPLFNAVEIYRTIFGRTDLKEVTVGEIWYFVQRIDWNTSSGVGDFSRLIVWPNISSFLFTNDYSYFDNLASEIKSIYTNTLTSGMNPTDLRNYATEQLWYTAPANLYGYNVTETNSVEWSLYADAFWHFGVIGIIFYVIIARLLYGKLFLFASRVITYKLVFFPVFSFIINLAFISGAISLPSIFKSMLNFFIFIIPLSWIYCFYEKRKRANL